ncbi:hypothetical protein Slin15195_G118520 [Septoria linicola]|uniref:Uncharacterized protein n=1 Tax=Septoria linicola TaxID=215465 RepID=A0A9Q9ERG1_9PEZI|nr:hypothetical protein Slin14017_G095510 [Septoria linicola]USW58533.1 hypothetical protein Slin15195_G118520 [Septoria linicola]
MVNNLPMSSVSEVHTRKKRHDTVLGLSESPPQDTIQQQIHKSILRHASTSTQSSIKSDSTTSSTRDRFHPGLLMSEGIPDPEAKARQVHYRRRLRIQVFNDAYLDWKSAPAVCDEQYDYASLLYRKELRCQASQQYLHQIQDELRRAAAAAAIRRSDSDDSGNIVRIDGEEMIDMIG